LKPLVNLFYTVEFVYNDFVCYVNSPITLHFVRSQWHILHAFQFAYNSGFQPGVATLVGPFAFF